MSSFLRTAGEPLGLAGLRARIDGDIVVPGDGDWDTARLAWNLAIDQHPALVALPDSGDDVASRRGSRPEPSGPTWQRPPGTGSRRWRARPPMSALSATRWAEA